MTAHLHDRSWWGWGNSDEELSAAEVAALTERVAMLVPGHDLTDQPPPSVAKLDLPRSRVEVPSAFADLASTEPLDRLGHMRGKAFRDVARNLAGDLSHVPDAVLRPRSEREVIDMLEWCSGAQVAAIPYGGGSSVVGGVEPRFDGPAVTLDLERLDQVLEVDPVSRAARIQAGTYGPALEDQLRPHGLTLRHFPQSFAYSTLGGWLATRAGGHFATLYTHIDDLTESIRVVTPAGVSESRRLPGSGAGPSPDRLFLGSEGTLGIITEAWMRVQARPRWKETATFDFADFDAAVLATRHIAQAGLFPTNCRLLDTGEAFVSAGISTSGGVLIVAFESADHPVAGWLDRAVAIAQDAGATVLSRAAQDAAASGVPDPAGSWRSTFLRMPFQRDALARRGMIAETFETACTWDSFGDVHTQIMAAAQEAIERVCGGGLVTCRFTHVYPDGPAPYYGVYAPGRRGSVVAQWDDIKAEVSEAITQHGATITHHHAVGRDHRPWYDQQRPEVFASALRAAKGALDPSGVLNPGVLI